MAIEAQRPVSPSLVAGADLSAAANQFTAVKLDANGNVIACTANTDRPLGILQNLPEEGDPAEVTIIGISKYRSSGIIGVGALMGVTATGTFEVVAAGAPTRAWFGRSLNATAVDGEYGSGVFNFVVPVPALTAN